MVCTKRVEVFGLDTSGRDVQMFSGSSVVSKTTCVIVKLVLAKGIDAHYPTTHVVGSYER